MRCYIHLSGVFLIHLAHIMPSNINSFLYMYAPQKWLRDAGYGSAQIHESIRRASIIKQQREKSTRTSTVVHELSQRFKTLGDFWKKKPHQRCGTETRKKSPSPAKDKINEVKGTDLLGSSRRGSLVGLSYNELDQKRSVDALAA